MLLSWKRMLKEVNIGGAHSLGKLIYQIKNFKTLDHVFITFYALSQWFSTCGL